MKTGLFTVITTSVLLAAAVTPAFAKTTNHQGSRSLSQVSTAYASAHWGGAYADTLSPADRQGFYYRQ